MISVDRISTVRGDSHRNDQNDANGKSRFIQKKNGEGTLSLPRLEEMRSGRVLYQVVQPYCVVPAAPAEVYGV